MIEEGTMSAGSGRAAVPGLRSPFPMREQVPSMLMDDPFLCRLLDGLDEVIAPVTSVLDSFDAYLDPVTAPIDFVRYLGSWMLATFDDPWDSEAVRRDVQQAHRRALQNGTAAGVQDRLVPHVAQSVAMRETGAVRASITPTDPAQWEDAAEPVFHITVVRHLDSEVDAPHLTKILRDVIPAHVGLELTIA